MEEDFYVTTQLFYQSSSQRIRVKGFFHSIVLLQLLMLLMFVGRTIQIKADYQPDRSTLYKGPLVMLPHAQRSVNPSVRIQGELSSL